MSCEIDTRPDARHGSLSGCRRVGSRRRHGLSLLELLAVVTILAVLSAVVVKGFSGADAEARKEACYINKGDIELQARLWFRNKASWPASDLSNIGADTQYFPGELPTCPVDGSTYTLDPVTHLVIGHTH